MGGRTTTTRRRALAGGVVLALTLLGTACDTEPPPPAAQFNVTSTDNLADANPGDGLCEATPGTGDCTVRAAIEEGNALGRADIHVPSGSYLADSDISVTGSIRIFGDSTIILGIDPASEVYGWSDARYEIAGGASLQVFDVFLNGTQVEVASGGQFAALRTRMSAMSNLLMYGRSGSTLTVADGGIALLQTAVIGNMASPTIDNRGTLMIDQSTVGGYAQTVFGFAAGPPMNTTGAGATYVRGSWLAGKGCTGTPPISMGYNAAVGTSCGLTGPTDHQNAPENKSGSGSSDAPSGVLVDAIPSGEAMCGTVLVDLFGNPRPVDGNLDGVAECDIGAREL